MLAMTQPTPWESLANELSVQLGASVDDELSFRVTSVRELGTAQLGVSGWRISVEASFEGEQFHSFRIDATREPDVPIPPDRLEFRNPLPEYRSIEVLIVSREQQFAEKIHAMTRWYGTGRPSTRIYDLVDLVALVREGKLRPPLVVAAVKHIFGQRGTHPVPEELADAPTQWNPFTQEGVPDYLSTLTVEEAMRIVGDFWASLPWDGDTKLAGGSSS